MTTIGRIKVRNALKTSPGGIPIIPGMGVLKVDGNKTSLSKTTIKKPGNHEED
jgi:hypothetical protein